MGCYPCTRCNKCGTFSARAKIVCAECGAEVLPGQFGCEVCGSTKIASMKLPDAKPTPRGNEKPAQASACIKDSSA